MSLSTRFTLTLQWPLCTKSIQHQQWLYVILFLFNCVYVSVCTCILFCVHVHACLQACGLLLVNMWIFMFHVSAKIVQGIAAASSALLMTVIPSTGPHRTVEAWAAPALILPGKGYCAKAAEEVLCSGCPQEWTAGHSPILININWIYKECWVNSHTGSLVNELLAWLHEVSVFL